ncbi:hypothetical protein NTGM5_180006 [Candidatus Nitrotoga sp. M5]|nr:hypothetical protein NTGM5_180006 [Candidatus Nitrotoga sp. M5]
MLDKNMPLSLTLSYDILQSLIIWFGLTDHFIHYVYTLSLSAIHDFAQRSHQAPPTQSFLAHLPDYDVIVDLHNYSGC